MILPVTIICGLAVAPLKEVLRIVHAGILGFSTERILTELKSLVSQENFPDFLEGMGFIILGIAVSMAVSLAGYHLLPQKWREKLRSVSWMMKPMPVAAARGSGTTAGRAMAIQ